MTILELFPDLETVWLEKHIPRILKKKRHEFIEYNHNTNNHFKVTAFRISDSQFASQLEDITQIVKSKQEIKESAQNFEQIFEPMQDSHLYVELIYNKRGKVNDYRFLQVIQSFLNLTNKKKPELIGRRAKAVFGQLSHYWVDQYQEVDKSGKPSTKEKYVSKYNSYIRSSAWKVSDGKVAVISTDITKRKLEELELIAAKEKAKESNRVKSAFLANMSHEIRTPMNGILGFASLLQDPSITGDQLKEYTTIIQKSGKRMINIINDIVDISKIEAGLTPLIVSESDINKQLEYLYTFFKQEFETKKIQLFYTCEFNPGDAIILTDWVKVFAILTNLIKNALKYTVEGSVEFGYHLNGNSIEFYVNDTGIGIARHKQNMIFERFMQINHPDARITEGTGLGLAISKAYAEILGGEIWVDSTPGRGSSFNFSIPNNKPNGSNKKKQKSIKSSFEENETKVLKIVVADDDSTSSYLLTVFLRQKHHDIIQVKNGQEAVDACRAADDIDLVLMDVRMPILDGYEATKQIRMFNSEVIIIAQTAYGLTGNREKAIKAGCNDYLNKPIDKAKLFELIGLYFDDN